jgi:hypothetical protein
MKFSQLDVSQESLYVKPARDMEIGSGYLDRIDVPLRNTILFHTVDSTIGKGFRFFLHLPASSIPLTTAKTYARWNLID